MRLPLALALLAGLAAPAWAQAVSVSARPERTTVVIYRFRPVETAYLVESLEDPDYAAREGLAMIVETRTLDLPAGESIIRFEGLATGVIPETAAMDGLPGRVLERNTDFEVLTPGSLVRRSIGETVQVVRVNRVTGVETTLPAVIRSGSGGPVLEIEGRLEPLSCQGLTQRLNFDRAPEGLSDRPMMSTRAYVPTAGRYTVRLAYLAAGLSWSADYVARLSPDGSSMDIQGWMTLVNFGDGGFDEARVQVVAGNLNTDDDTEPVEAEATTLQAGCWPMDTTTRNGPLVTASPTMVIDYLATLPALSNSLVDDETQIDEIVVTGSRIMPALASLGDYKIYTLPETTDLEARQAKQLRFFDQSDVRFTRLYSVVVDHDDDDQPLTPELLVRLRNEAGAGLGVPMPGGGVSLVEEQDGTPILTGQASFLDKGSGVPVELVFGRAMDLSVTFEASDEERWTVGDVRMRRASVAVQLVNDKDWAVEMEVLTPWSVRPGFRVLRESRRSAVNPSGDRAWRVRVPAHGSQTLTYTIQSED